MEGSDKKGDFMKFVGDTLANGIKMKTVMLKKGLQRARAKCPKCEGELQGALVGPKKHLRFWCTGTCGQQMIE
jgi:hypothetical protein